MPYNVSDSGPVNYALNQQGRQDDNFKNLLNMLVMGKQNQQNLGLEQQKLAQQQAQYQGSQSLEQQKLEAQKTMWAAQTENEKAQGAYHKAYADYLLGEKEFDMDDTSFAGLMKQANLDPYLQDPANASKIGKGAKKALAATASKILENQASEANKPSEVVNKYRIGMNMGLTGRSLAEFMAPGTRSASQTLEETMDLLKKRGVAKDDADAFAKATEYHRQPTLMEQVGGMGGFNGIPGGVTPGAVNPGSVGNTNKPDQFGFVVGQKRPDKNGVIRTYLGNDQWQ
jgi:hypothetical protein